MDQKWAHQTYPDSLAIGINLFYITWVGNKGKKSGRAQPS